MNKNNYHNHTSVEDLLRDDFFISSMLSPTDETAAFWENLLHSGALSASVFEEAKEKLCGQGPSMDEQGKALLFERIQRSSRRPVSMISFYRAAAAVLIAGLLLSVWLFWPGDKLSENLAQAEHPALDTGEILLRTADGKTMNIEGSEAVLDFSQANAISINKKEIDVSQMEAAEQHEARVPAGKRISLILPDGTKLWVNAGSTVKFPSRFPASKREIQVDGEVYADVVKDAKKPFVFHTKDFDVQVLGTSLNIHAYAQEKQHRVTLVEGKVKVNSAAGEHVLLPNDSYVKTDAAESVAIVDVAYFTSWKDGYYRFKEQPLREVIRNLERYYGAQINYEPQIAQLKCSGNLDLKEDLHAVLRGVAFSMDIQLKKDNNTYNLQQ